MRRSSSLLTSGRSSTPRTKGLAVTVVLTLAQALWFARANGVPLSDREGMTCSCSFFQAVITDRRHQTSFGHLMKARERSPYYTTNQIAPKWKGRKNSPTLQQHPAALGKSSGFGELKGQTLF